MQKKDQNTFMMGNKWVFGMKNIFFPSIYLSISKGFQLSKGFHPHIWTWELGRVLGDS
jgi:hypothetical protein